MIRLPFAPHHLTFESQLLTQSLSDNYPFPVSGTVRSMGIKRPLIQVHFPTILTLMSLSRIAFIQSMVLLSCMLEDLARMQELGITVVTAEG